MAFLLFTSDILTAGGTLYGFQRHSVVKQYIATQSLLKNLKTSQCKIPLTVVKATKHKHDRGLRKHSVS